jgi:hypothetical protein
VPEPDDDMDFVILLEGSITDNPHVLELVINIRQAVIDSGIARCGHIPLALRVLASALEMLDGKEGVTRQQWFSALSMAYEYESKINSKPN